jgi:hypothetical protein
MGGKASARTNPNSGGGLFSSQRDLDLDALADMLITETRFRSSKAEMAAIVYIAVNRARSQGRSIAYVVQPGLRDLGSCPSARTTRCLQWNAGSPYRRMFAAARGNALWPEARAFAAKVIDGTSGYRNTGARSFVHPGSSNFNMPCNPESPPVQKGYWSPSYVPGYGTRCIPKWVQSGTVIGKGMFA